VSGVEVPEVILYSRPHCGLCDEAAVEIRALATELGFTFVERDVDASADARERYGDVIPVVEIDGHPLLTAPFFIESLRDVLADALR
jgi:hypothetical protein